MRMNEDGLQWCGRNQHWVEPEDFHKNTVWCKKCRDDYRREHYDPGEIRKRNFNYYHKQDSTLYDYLFQLQNGICAICKNPPKARKTGRNKMIVHHLCLDYDHKTGRAKGLLCHECNSIVGYLKNRDGYLDSIKTYLNEEKD